MGCLFMLRMLMIMGPMVFRVIVIMIACLPLMAVCMAVFVIMRMAMGMRVRMAVLFAFVLVGVFMLMHVLMFVLMLVFVIAFHFKSSLLYVVLSNHLVSSTRPSPSCHHNWIVMFSDDDGREPLYHAQGGRDRDNDWVYDHAFDCRPDGGE